MHFQFLFNSLVKILAEVKKENPTNARTSGLVLQESEGE